jgi:Transport and Golgi organisation 2
MCTLTIIPWNAPCPGSAVEDGERGAGVRIACNRDESRLRPAAIAPQLRRIADQRAYMPLDPLGGGTWIAVNDAPLALVLMNVYTQPIENPPAAIQKRSAPPVSRGTIIPHVLAGGNLAGALARARDLDLAQFEPFRLVLADREQFAEVVWAAGRFDAADPAAIREPLFFTSSGLGDEVVASPRRKLFDQVLCADFDRAAAQDAFHRHVWPGREFASVWMTRPEARTVSLTIVELGPRDVRMLYYAREDDASDGLEAEQSSLPIAKGSADAAR